MQATFDIIDVILGIVGLCGAIGVYVEFKINGTKRDLTALIEKQGTQNTHLIELLDSKVDDMEKAVRRETKHLEDTTEQLRATVAEITQKTTRIEVVGEQTLKALNELKVHIQKQ